MHWSMRYNMVYRQRSFTSPLLPTVTIIFVSALFTNNSLEYVWVVSKFLFTLNSSSWWLDTCEEKYCEDNLIISTMDSIYTYRIQAAVWYNYEQHTVSVNTHPWYFSVKLICINLASVCFIREVVHNHFEVHMQVKNSFHVVVLYKNQMKHCYLSTTLKFYNKVNCH